MTSSADLQLVVPPMYPRFSISGPLGVRPDTQILIDVKKGAPPFSHTCQRPRLPPNIETFKFVERGAFDKPRPLANLYCLSEFLIVDSDMLDFISDELDGEIEYKEIRPELLDGSRPQSTYFAVKIARTIDCIDPDKSFYHSRRGTEKFDRSFSEVMFECDLSEQCATEFSNAGYGKYRSFPDGLLSIGHVAIKEGSVSAGSRLFQPLNWPGHLIGETTFLRSLAAKCMGGTLGYYFWALDLSDVSQAYSAMCQAMR